MRSAYLRFPLLLTPLQLPPGGALAGPSRPPQRVQRRRNAFEWTLTFVALYCASCSSDPNADSTNPSSAPEEWAVEREFNQGAPVTFVLRLDKTELALSGTVTLEEELRIEEGFEADFPEYLPEDFEGFSVVEITRDRKDDKDKGEGNGRTRKRLTLEPNRSGKLAIAPLAVYFHRAGEAQESRFLTDEITVEVNGIDDISELSLSPLRGIYEAPPEASSAGYTWVVAGVGVLVVLLGAVFFLRRGPPKPSPAIAPHESAYEALRRLVAMNLVEKGEIELFFVHLSSILREYIEGRFLVHAPELTTEEFLEEATRNPVLSEHQLRLGQFLALCDRVKFARFQPDDTTIQGAFDVVKQFLEETKFITA